VGDIADVKYAPNFNEIRSRYPDRMAEIIKAVKGGAFRMAGDMVTLQIDGKEESFDAEIILVTYQARAGQHVASGQGIVVSLDLTLTEELKAEGLARDMVRNIQDARKQMGCEITDVVLLAFEGDVPGQWLEYICRETLGQLSNIVNPESAIEIEADEGKRIKIFISKAP
ncbi:MAG: isoleucine--tRNA ligase, partial [Acetatifactor sp.]|nr:isoleucine--tRNA ligase [Acetatifactor sp.]